MRPGVAARFFMIVVAVGLLRSLAYVGTHVGQDLSAAAVLEYLALHVLSFAFATFLIAALSRTTAIRAVAVALYAQAALLLAPFIDLATGLPVESYAATYVGLPGGTPGGFGAGILYGAILAWGAWDGTVGARSARSAHAFAAGALGVIGLSLVASPFPGGLFAEIPAYGRHVGMATYDGILVLLFLDLAVRFADAPAHRTFWRQPLVWWLPAFILLPMVGVGAAGRMSLLPNPAEPILRYQVEGPYLLGAASVGGLVWAQRAIVRTDAWGALRMETARLVKVAALSLSFLLGWGAFLACAAAASVVWIERDRANSLAFALVCAATVLVGDLAVPAIDFADLGGPIPFTVAVAQTAWPSLIGVSVAAVISEVGALGAFLTSRTSA